MGKKCPLKTVALAVHEKEKAIKGIRGTARNNNKKTKLKTTKWGILGFMILELKGIKSLRY